VFSFQVYRCEFCERFYADPAFLSAHRSNHTDEPLPFKCHICGAGFATFARVATHKVTHGVYEKKDEFSVPKLYLCDSCDKAYVHWTYLSVHRKMIHAEVKHMYKCKVCIYFSKQIFLCLQWHGSYMLVIISCPAFGYISPLCHALKMSFLAITADFCPLFICHPILSNKLFVNLH
jgi:hypothetical protein